jgi:hypothetical protein
MLGPPRNGFACDARNEVAAETAQVNPTRFVERRQQFTMADSAKYFADGFVGGMRTAAFRPSRGPPRARTPPIRGSQPQAATDSYCGPRGMPSLTASNVKRWTACSVPEVSRADFAVRGRQ